MHIIYILYNCYIFFCICGDHGLSLSQQMLIFKTFKRLTHLIVKSFTIVFKVQCYIKSFPSTCRLKPTTNNSFKFCVGKTNSLIDIHNLKIYIFQTKRSNHLNFVIQSAALFCFCICKICSMRYEYAETALAQNICR